MNVSPPNSPMAKAAMRRPLLGAESVSEILSDYGTRSEHGENGNEQSANLSTFGGVLVPCMLSIFGVILFLRAPWCLGQAGLFYKILMTWGGYIVVTLTTSSISAIASNGKMKGGGAYYMISRALGPEFGGAIGIIFYSANVVGCALYLTGFSSALVSGIPGMPSAPLWQTLYGSIALFLLTIVCLVGADAYAKTSLIIWTVLITSITFAVGCLLFQGAGFTTGYTSWSLETFHGNLYPDYSDTPKGAGDQSFHAVFAIFFPAVTGIMAGANLSGDLATPSKSIPKGTLSAIGITCFVYTSLDFICAATVTRGALQHDYFIIQHVSQYSWVVTIGIFASTLSSALGNQIGGSKVLQAVARDGIIPFLSPFAVGTKSKGEPYMAIALSWCIIQALLFLADLNVIATVTTMFFLISYGIVNFACFALQVSGTPNFRPTFEHSNPVTSFAGFVLCLATMFYVGPIYAAVAIAFLVTLFAYIHYIRPSTDWGHLSQAIMYHQVRKYLLRLDVRKEHVKYWRPQILLLTDKLEGQEALLDFVNNLKKGGLYVIGSVVLGAADRASRDEYFDRKAGMTNFIANSKLKAFPEVVIAPDVLMGVQTMLSLTGLGALVPNTVGLGFVRGFDDDDGAGASIDGHPRRQSGHVPPVAINSRSSSGKGDEEAAIGGVGVTEYVEIIKDIISFRKNVIIFRNFEKLDKDLITSTSSQRWFKNRDAHTTRDYTIDLWPLAMEASSEHSFTLTLLMGWILHLTDIWSKHTRLRVLSCTLSDEAAEKEREHLQAVLTAARIPAEIEIVPVQGPHLDAFRDTLAGLRQGDEGKRMDLYKKRYTALNELIRTHSSEACLIFSTLNQPPMNQGAYYAYMDGLAALTQNLPPTCLIYGVRQFISTDL